MSIDFTEEKKEQLTTNPVLSFSYDDMADVLYVKHQDVRIVNSIEAPNDNFLILNLGIDGAVVGIQLLAVHKLGINFWFRHLDRLLLPSDICQVVDEVVQKLGRQDYNQAVPYLSLR